MSKILIIASDFRPHVGGRADYIDNLVKGLKSRSLDVTVLAVCKAHQKERIKFLETYEKSVLPFPVEHDRRPAHWIANKCVSVLEIARCMAGRLQPLLECAPCFHGSASAVRRLNTMLEDIDPDVVVFGHMDLRLYPFALSLLRKRIPYVIIAHESEIYRFACRTNESVRKKMMLRGARWIAANSHHTRRIAQMWELSDEQVRIIYPPVSQVAIRLGRQAHKRNDNEQLKLVTVCRLVKPKAVDVVLHALKLLKERSVPFRYVVAGDGPERHSLEALAAEHGISGCVRFQGYVEDAEKWQLLSESDIFVLPSRVDPRVQHEGFGIAFIEAAAFGLAAVGSNAGGIPDAIVDGETGMLVPQDSAPDLADALQSLYENPAMRQEMGRRGMERAKQFSPAAIAARFEEELFGQAEKNRVHVPLEHSVLQSHAS
jgi:glycosyltransferase involved in cell wall biosynthesis